MDVEQRLAAVERRLAALEEQPPPGPAEEGDDALWAIDALSARVGPPGAVLLAGTVTLPDGRAARWQEGRARDDLLDVDVVAAAAALAALGSPIRLRLVLRLLDEPATVQDLLALDGLGTSGQVYHHLRLLTAAGWVRSLGGGRHEVPVARVVPLLAALLAAGP